MKVNTPRFLPRIYFCLLLITIGLVVLMPGTATVSSSNSPDSNARDAANDRWRDAELFRDPEPNRAYPLLRGLQQLLPANKIAPQVLADTTGGKSTSVVILLTDQADVSAAYEMKDQDARGWYVYNTLSKHAARTQVGLQSFLKAQGVTYQSFWAANMLVASVDRTVAESLAARADVARVDSNKPGRWIEDPVIADFHESSSKPSSPDAAEWGVMNVNAPAVWALGFTGQGMVIGDLDTGMRWTHNALKPKYRGWNGTVADHNFNWHDSIHSQIPGSPAGNVCGRNILAPCDDQGHGTHTAGTTVGDDGTNQVGVAPGAKWIGCRNMDSGNGTPATYTECFQFTIAPTDLAGNNANPTLRPHVLNNSWGCPVSEGCTTGAELETIVNNTQAAGIFVEVSAGNSGPSCSTVADAPAIYSASFSTGAIDISNNLAGFSSRGPSLFYTPNVLKPNVSAPGVNVRSSTFGSDSSFGNLSGTSMAGPHVVGVVALLWSARPALVRNIAATKALLQNTANPAVTVSLQTCGGIPSTQIPNNSFGYGRVDALAAVNSTPLITGRVTYEDGATAAKNVTLTLTAPSFTQRQTTTDSNGDYAFTNVPAGNSYTVTPTKSGDANGLESLDASGVARFAAGLDVPTANQQMAADADGDGLVTSLDASFVARYVAGLPGFGIVGTWKFAAPNRTYPALSADQAGQNFKAVLVGDTSGNWLPSIPSGGGENASQTVPMSSKSASLTNGPNAPLAVTVSLPHVTGPTTTGITVPITVGDLTGQGVKAYDLQITFDPLVVQPQGTPFDTAGTISSGMLITPNTNNAGHLIISAFQATDLAGAGTLINLKFTIVGAPGAVTTTLFQDYTDPGTIFHPGFRFNAGTPAATISNGSIHVNGPTAAAASISGQVISASGQPVEGAVVRLGGDQTRKTITDANGYYHFDNVDTGGFYTVTPSRVNYNFNPFSRSFSQVGNRTDAVFTAASTGDNVNPLDTAEYFVRQQYVDVLSREPDEGGFNYWSDQILACNSNAQCVSTRRRDVAAAFFIEQEAQQTSSYIYDMYAGALGRKPAFSEYSGDRQQVIGGTELEVEKTAFAEGFVQRAEFVARYESKTTAISFVDALIQNVQSSGVDLSGERANLIAAYTNAASMSASRAAVVRAVAENVAFKESQYNSAFVLTEYFGYLRRDIDQGGYDFWLNVLNNREPGNYRGMVCSFVTSAEYQNRFSAIVSHNNGECGQ
jgi:subtilisin family serine protease